jgi:hypothetical protein
LTKRAEFSRLLVISLHIYIIMVCLIEHEYIIFSLIFSSFIRRIDYNIFIVNAGHQGNDVHSCLLEAGKCSIARRVPVNEAASAHQ